MNRASECKHDAEQERLDELVREQHSLELCLGAPDCEYCLEEQQEGYYDSKGNWRSIHD